MNTDATCDALGTVHGPAGVEARIVSLVPSITELLCDLDLSAQLVGRTGFCIHPWETMRQIPKVGGTKDVLIERVRELRPSHVIVNIDENLLETAERIREFVPNVVVTHPKDPRENPGLYRLLGRIFDRDSQAEGLCRRFSQAYQEVTRYSRPPENVLYLVWREPWMTIARDTYISRTLALINWQTLPLDSNERYPEVALPSYAGRVSRVLLSSEPFHFKQHHIAEVQALVAGASVTLIDGEMTSWYGSRAIEGLNYLAELGSRYGEPG